MPHNHLAILYLDRFQLIDAFNKKKCWRLISNLYLRHLAAILYVVTYYRLVAINLISGNKIKVRLAYIIPPMHIFLARDFGSYNQLEGGVCGVYFGKENQNCLWLASQSLYPLHTTNLICFTCREVMKNGQNLCESTAWQQKSEGIR